MPQVWPSGYGMRPVPEVLETSQPSTLVRRPPGQPASYIREGARQTPRCPSQECQNLHECLQS